MPPCGHRSSLFAVFVRGGDRTHHPALPVAVTRPPLSEVDVCLCEELLHVLPKPKLLHKFWLWRSFWLFQRRTALDDTNHLRYFPSSRVGVLMFDRVPTWSTSGIIFAPFLWRLLQSPTFDPHVFPQREDVIKLQLFRLCVDELYLPFQDLAWPRCRAHLSSGPSPSRRLSPPASFAPSAPLTSLGTWILSNPPLTLSQMSRSCRPPPAEGFPADYFLTLASLSASTSSSHSDYYFFSTQSSGGQGRAVAV